MDDKKKPLSDKQFDEMLRMAVSESVEKEMSALPPDEETQRLYPFSGRHEQRMAELFGQKRRRSFFAIRKPLKIAAAFLLALVMTFSVLMINDDIRAEVIGTIIERYEQFTRFVFRIENVSEDDSLIPVWRPTHIPDGFYETYVHLVGMYYIVVYENADGAMILFDYITEDGHATAIGTTYARHYEKEHDGITYHVFVPLVEIAPTVIVWEVAGAAFSIAGDTDPDALMAMAQSVEIVDWVERE
jgi:hypothetical protein